MQLKNTGDTLEAIIKHNASAEEIEWIAEKLNKIISAKSAKDLYLSYSLLSGKVSTAKEVNFPNQEEQLSSYMAAQQANLLQISRIYLLVKVLEEDADYFLPKVARLIQLADTGELETFLKFLILLPHAEEYKNVAVEALRTNIATVFDAIALNNPYPTKYFNDQQWNQMYLKAAFMQRNLNEIMDVEKRANKDLTRIISDYAHERWAASRDIDPLFWRPVSNFIEGVLLEDMQRLLESSHPQEAAVAALCCFYSEQPSARALLDKYPELKEKVKADSISWKNLKSTNL
ncbi:EboA domain-containing protein [Muriicola sp. Z0-33]|uniref:EboA domain-containing protein n=1 Tax=Muriicola sp. Z0-33 TaxID=2816957 RepID=UPI002237BFBA|nr:EboA domain-containing protein [Muriicola sp. Z0-33]MCW5517455.1 EboA domain-containing protein [Muriicola sp. Z0-33]